MIFLFFNLATLLFFCSKAPVQHGFLPQFSQKSKKIVIFFAIFSRCVSIS